MKSALSRGKPGISAAGLRMLALATMLLDHMGAVLWPQALWMRILGRLAFPIFAFQIAEGYRRTHDFRGYCLRLLGMGLISEVPFDLMASGMPFYLFHQNVMFTLLLGLLMLRQADLARAETDPGKTVKRCLWMALICLGAIVAFPDYGLAGVLTVAVFHLFRVFPHARVWELLAMVGLHCFALRGGPELALGGISIPMQSFAVLALIPIWLYNGEKGPGGKGFRLLSYAFYPVHMLILALCLLL